MMAVVTEPVATAVAAVVRRGVSDLFLYAFHAQSTRSSHPGAGRAQWVERWTEKPGAILTRVQVPGAARDFSPRVNFLCRLSYGVRTVCNRIHQHLCARKKIPSLL